MAKANLICPLASAHGSIFGLCSEYYARTYRGRQIVQKKPRHFSANQLQNQQAFGQKYGTNRKGLPKS